MTLAAEVSTCSSLRDGQTVGVPCVCPKAALTALESPQSRLCSRACSPACVSRMPKGSGSGWVHSVCQHTGTCFQSLCSPPSWSIPCTLEMQLSWQFPTPRPPTQPGVSPSGVSRCSFFPFSFHQRAASHQPHLSSEPN